MSRLTEEQIIGVLREQEAGATTAAVCHRHDASEQTFYRPKTKNGGPGPSDAQRLTELEDENRRLKKLLAKKLSTPEARRSAALRLIAECGYSQRRACRLIEADPNTVRREPASDLRLPSPHRRSRSCGSCGIGLYNQVRSHSAHGGLAPQAAFDRSAGGHRGGGTAINNPGLSPSVRDRRRAGHGLQLHVEEFLWGTSDSSGTRRSKMMPVNRSTGHKTKPTPTDYSGALSPLPPNSDGKSFILGKPSFIGSTVSA